MKTSFPLLLFFVLTLASCGDDDYASEPPLLDDITVKSLSTGSDEIHAGEKLVATAVQRKRGKLLYKAKYQWSISDEDESISHKYKTAVVYDYEPQDPTDTLIINKAGTYTLKFYGHYDNSGSTNEWGDKHGYSFTENFNEKKFSATYTTGGAITFEINATKTITVLP